MPSCRAEKGSGDELVVVPLGQSFTLNSIRQESGLPAVTFSSHPYDACLLYPSLPRCKTLPGSCEGLVDSSSNCGGWVALHPANCHIQSAYEASHCLHSCCLMASQSHAFRPSLSQPRMRDCSQPRAGPVHPAILLQLNTVAGLQ